MPYNQAAPNSQLIRAATAAPGAGKADATRLATVDRARKGWIKRLIDLSRRNNLLYYRDLATGTVSLDGADPGRMGAFLAGEPVALAQLLPDEDEVRLAARVKEIRRRATANAEERGLETLFVGYGMATWPVDDGGRPPESAVLLLPVTLNAGGREQRKVTIARAGEVKVNLALLHALHEVHGCEVDSAALVGEADDEDAAFDPSEVFRRLTVATRAVSGFRINTRAILGNFSFQKMALVRDLVDDLDTLAGHDLIAAIAGDAGAQAALRDARREVDVREIDRTPPAAEFLVLDADSTQQRAITAAIAGQHGVIQGPPGCGKSQTIANLIASLVAEGKRVLFVAEKRAALDVVHRRLEAAGLGHVALDLHGADVRRKAVMRRVGHTLDVIRTTAPAKAESVHQRVFTQRIRLNDHVDRTHRLRLPANLSVFEMQGRLLELTKSSDTVVTRWRGTDLNELGKYRDNVRDLLVEAAGFGALFVGDDPSPWAAANVPNGTAALKAFDAATSLAGRDWPELERRFEALAVAAGHEEPCSLTDAEALLSLYEGVAATLAYYRADVFREAAILSTALAPATQGLFRQAWALLTNVGFREARRRARSLRHGGSVSSASMAAELSEAVEQSRAWGARHEVDQAQMPSVASLDLVGARTLLTAVKSALGVVATALGRANLPTLQLAQLGQLLKDLAADRVTPTRLPRVREIEHALHALGASGIVAELRGSRHAMPQARREDAIRWPKRFEYAFLASCLDRARAEETALAGFNGRAHDAVVEQFCEDDAERLELAAERVRHAHAQRAIDAMNSFPSQEALVRREAEKKHSHLPLRTLLAQAPDVLTAVCPCWMASPLSVSQLLSTDRRYFDVVVFDEASQVLPEDAVPSLLRAGQVVVAGDKHQLPPTTFFADGGGEVEEDPDPSGTVGFESLLDVMSAFVAQWPLEWHYRSHDESLIAFSNRHIYGGRLVTFPGVGGEPVVSHELVMGIPDSDGQEESASPEVQRVVELCLDHAATRPNETLGLIAMGIPHARRIEAALDRALLLHPQLDTFFDQSRTERFFVKNLERVQGDERDAIIFTVGYGKDRSGRLLYRFGPLLQDNGYRRLNVAVTRARQRMKVVSSFSHHDMDPSRSSSRGVELLRLYLEYAASGGRRLGDAGASQVPLNSFEQDVFDALTTRGIALEPQWGASAYRIDMVAKHPVHPGRFVLAIECDGASYHSAPTARDRDRLRQEHLEALGWKFLRIWSTDWFDRREAEIERAVARYREAVAFADRPTLGGSDAMGSRLSGSGLRLRDKGQAPIGHAPGRATTNRQSTDRGPRPLVPRRAAISDYDSSELAALIQWIGHDGINRTDDEIVSAMVAELGFARRGSRIERAIRAALDRTKRRADKLWS
ncbi:MAG: DUF4011 domain-containing protein [Gemmatimonadota bacterium]|nr:DUF4011 domain-containing protein [Gemmatimonadota bacterium]